MWMPIIWSDVTLIWIALICQAFFVSSESYHGSTSTVEKDTPENSSRVETGLEFIQKEHQIQLDYHLFFWKVEQPEASNFLKIARIFIRNVKGLPADTEGENAILVSGTDMDKKPAYCFYPYVLTKLVNIEFKIYEILKEFQEKVRDTPIPVLDSYLKDFEESSLRAKEQLETLNDSEDPYLYIATHPLLTYRLVRRYAEDLQPIFKIVKNLQPVMIYRLHQEANPELLVFPTMADLDDAVVMIARMQHGNDLNTYKVARGILENIDTGIYLNALHCLEIGAFYRDQTDFDFAIQWFHNALETAKKYEAAQYHAAILEFFYFALKMTIDEHNDIFTIRLEERWEIGIFNSTVSLPFEPTAYVRRLTELNPEASRNRHTTAWNWATHANFKRVCSGENLLSEAEKALLKCWYHKQPHPYWYINPLKTEMLHMDPPVLQMYDFIGDKLAERMKQEVVDQLHRSQVVDRSSPGQSGYVVDHTRTSSQAWLDDTKDSTFLQPLTRKLEMMSGLTIMPRSACDQYQVAAYGPSHHYDAHIDSFEDGFQIDEQGNRITTIMGYLSEVKAGGKTGFPVLGIAAEPIKGSIVMWNNLKRNGKMREEQTWHGGCPVVLGVKWITNKWVYYTDNFRNFRCTLDPAS